MCNVPGQTSNSMSGQAKSAGVICDYHVPGMAHGRMKDEGWNTYDNLQIRRQLTQHYRRIAKVIIDEKPSSMTRY
jgi:hypothetical protein